MNKPYIVWQCPHCDALNITENHSDKNAHFISMECEHCGEEVEECLCDSAIGVKQLKQFFDKPGINKSGICEEAGITQQYLNRVLNETQPLSYGIIEKLIPVMIEYGFLINN
jgi:transcription elongation factor Elf1